MSSDLLLVDRSEPIVRITLNNPEQRNAMPPEMGIALTEAVQEINADRKARVVVVRGAGRAFSAGGNLDNLEAETRGEREREAGGLGGGARFYRLFLSIRDLEVPTIAAVNGHAVGAGLCFALAHDLRVIHERAKLGVTFTRLGIHPGMAATWTLPRLIGSSRAADLLYTGRLITAQEALEMGIANRIGGDDDFDATVNELAERIAGSGPVAVRGVKETLRGTFDRTIDDALEREGAVQARTFTTDDAKEGIAAIKARREPEFKGR